MAERTASHMPHIYSKRKGTKCWTLALLCAYLEAHNRTQFGRYKSVLRIPWWDPISVWVLYRTSYHWTTATMTSKYMVLLVGQRWEHMAVLTAGGQLPLSWPLYCAGRGWPGPATLAQNVVMTRIYLRMSGSVLVRVNTCAYTLIAEIR